MGQIVGSEGQMTCPCRHISISINRPPKDVYEFASNPMNLPRWFTNADKVSGASCQRLTGVQYKAPVAKGIPAVTHTELSREEDV
jgi:hypothetical protein